MWEDNIIFKYFCLSWEDSRLEPSKESKMLYRSTTWISFLFYLLIYGSSTDFCTIGWSKKVKLWMAGFSKIEGGNLLS